VEFAEFAKKMIFFTSDELLIKQLNKNVSTPLHSFE